MRQWVVALAVTVAAAAAAQSPPAERPDASRWSAEQWRAAALGDVAAAYRLYYDNHPGPHDPNNPGFRAQLRGARDSALAVAGKADSAAGYGDSLGTFSVALADHHATLGMVPASGAAPRFSWPGFIVAWRDGRLLVHSAEGGSGVARGEEIVACDGLDPGALARRNLATSSSYPLTPGEYWVIGGAPFSSIPETEARRARECRVRGADGAQRTVALEWRRAPGDFITRRTLARMGERTDIGLTEPRPGLFLIGMPTFSPSDSEVAQYHRLYDALAKRAKDIARARAIVIDLRHNQGGSSSWSQEAGRLLWGADSAPSERANEVWWRASPGNTGFVSGWEELFTKQKRPAETITWARRVRQGMRSALAAGRKFFVEKDDAPAAGRAGAARRTPARLTTPVYVITHGHCGSACLDALDLFTAHRNVRLIGAPSASDTDYMDVRAETLPSGVGRMSIPMKVYVGRARRSGTYYRPDILMTSLDWSTAAFLDRVEADLGRPTAVLAPGERLVAPVR